jgi:hypothetical protein
LLAAGAAFHAFGKNADLKVMAIVFLIGVIGFAVGYGVWFFINLDLDHALEKSDNDPRLDALFPSIKKKSPEDILKSVKRSAVAMYMAGFISLVCFLLGLLTVIRLAIRL